MMNRNNESVYYLAWGGVVPAVALFITNARTQTPNYTRPSEGP